MDLNELRNEIDKLDKEILNAFATRMDICKRVALYKKENNLPIFQGNRENEVLNKIKVSSPENLLDSTTVLFSSIMDISKSLQQQELFKEEKYLNSKILDLDKAKKIGCQGVKGANSEAAAFELFGEEKEIVFYHDFEDVFKAVESGKVDFGVLPIQNSTTGSVAKNYDLMKQYDMYIAKMVRTQISNCLAVKNDIDVKDIKAVYSHPQALFQCSKFLYEYNLRQIPYENTASAAKLVSKSDENIAAICSLKCAKLYNLRVLKETIADSPSNYTRFICISKDFYKEENSKTISILVTIPNTQGSLYRLLTKFYVIGLNLQKIESRPIPDGSFDVMFYLDFEGDIEDKKVTALLTELDNEMKEFKFLGNYNELF